MYALFIVDKIYKRKKGWEKEGHIVLIKIDALVCITKGVYSF
jgi:hypothetical protein